MVKQVRVTLSCQDHQQSAIIPVQKDTPMELLLGTDVPPHLGFVVWHAGGDGLGTDLLQGDSWGNITVPPTIPDPPTELEKTDDKAVKCAREELHDPVSDEEPMETHSTNPDQSVGVVKLLQATRFPARHKRLLRAKVEGLSVCLSMPEAVVQLDSDNIVTLVLRMLQMRPHD